eukprot:CAMPEP_0203012740 /NCGR_PEP_ID=MMETSP1401-20130829/14228_1 /ASSEMBLY_ACC=CAM_ASM_000894 /TAXON_ID=38833 /ORGANISM="Micromonas pusilla, Strain CCAC1681" /LENGTH=124 /DNA_ID=CAMNT_0049754443 /DNA_START=14 /DNA_END=385 /DNA_ORIENTATION=+
MILSSTVEGSGGEAKRSSTERRWKAPRDGCSESGGRLDPDAEAAAGTRTPAPARPRGGLARYQRVHGCRADRNTRARGSRARLRARFRARRASMRSETLNTRETRCTGDGAVRTGLGAVDDEGG